MIKKLLAGAALAAMTVAFVAAPAAADVTVGSSDSGNCYPFVCNDSGVSVGQSIDFQEIYSSTAFSGPLTFAAITFFTWSTQPAVSVLAGNYNITFGTTLAPVGSGYPVGPLSNVVTFYNGALGGPVGSTYAISGTPYTYNPADGNLVMEIVVTNQTALGNGSGNGYFLADYTGAQVSRAYLETNVGTGGPTGALVTRFGAGVPEPATWALMLAGFGATGAALRRAHRKQANVGVA